LTPGGEKDTADATSLGVIFCEEINRSQFASTGNAEDRGMGGILGANATIGVVGRGKQVGTVRVDYYSDCKSKVETY